jgi:hypothetical protein
MGHLADPLEHGNPGRGALILYGRVAGVGRMQYRLATEPRGCAEDVMTTVFLISPARCGGKRAEILARSRNLELGQQLQGGGAPIGEVFAWLSALYFRGKLAYARRFAAPPPALAKALVMAPGAGLRDADTRITAAELRAMGTVDVESAAFIRPLRRDAAVVNQLCGGGARIVLLGSIATGKYIDTLLEVFGTRLLFPDSFVGRGDMSRGGLLLRAARSGEELSYVPIYNAVLHGPRPPRLPRERRSPRPLGD